MNNIPFESDVNLKSVVIQLKGCNCADVSNFCKRIKMSLIYKEIYNRPEKILTKQDFDNELSKFSSSVRQEDLDLIKEFKETV